MPVRCLRGRLRLSSASLSIEVAVVDPISAEDGIISRFVGNVGSK
jgi:hypothetical protein